MNINSIDSHTVTPEINNVNFAQRAYSRIGSFARRVESAASKGLKALSMVRSERNAFEHGLKVVYYAFEATQLIGAGAEAIGKVMEKITKTNTVIDLFQILESGAYWLKLGFIDDLLKGNILNILKLDSIDDSRKGNILNIPVQGCFTAAGIGGGLLFLGECGIIDLAKIGAAIGRLPIFGAVTHLGLSLGTAVTGVVGIAFIFMGANAGVGIIKNLMKGDENQGWHKSLWTNVKGLHKWENIKKTLSENKGRLATIAWCVAEVALKALIITGVLLPAVAASAVFPWALLGLGIVAAGLGVTSYLVNNWNGS